MKHVKVLTSEKPASADEWAWVDVKNVLFPGQNLSNDAAVKLASDVDQWLQP
jgi:hypothetical protein